MSSHLDNARKELTAQRRILAHDINQMTRQLKKIDQALAHLAPANGSKPITRNQPDKAERERRREVLYTFHKDRLHDMSVKEFDLDDLLDHTQEPQELRRAYDSLVRNEPELFERIKTGLYKVI